MDEDCTVMMGKDCRRGMHGEGCEGRVRIAPNCASKQSTIFLCDCNICFPMYTLESSSNLQVGRWGGSL